jgi:hypothetical protein
MANFGLPEGRTWNLFGLPDWLKRQFPEGWHKQPFGNQVPTMLPGLTLPRDRLGDIGEATGLLGITEEEYWKREKDKMGKQYRGVGGQGALPYTMEGMKEGIAARLATAGAKKSEMDALKKLSNMMMLASIAEATQADKYPPPSPRSVGTTKQPVSPSLMSTIPQRRQRDDLLNYLSRRRA